MDKKEVVASPAQEPLDVNLWTYKSNPPGNNASRLLEMTPGFKHLWETVLKGMIMTVLILVFL